MRLWKWLLLIGMYVCLIAVLLKRKQEEDDRIAEIENDVEYQRIELLDLENRVNNLVMVADKVPA